MNVLIVHAHPEPKSFCSSLKNAAAAYFENKGDSVIINDLYTMKTAMEFGGKNDFKALADYGYFIYHNEQRKALENDDIKDDIKAEMEKLKWADLIIFNFPLWWFSFPAIMRNWVERTFLNGFTYSANKGEPSERVLQGKTAMCVITTGGPEFVYSEEGSNGAINLHLYHIEKGLFRYQGMNVLPHFIAYGPHKKPDEERQNYIDSFIDRLSKLEI